MTLHRERSLRDDGEAAPLWRGFPPVPLTGRAAGEGRPCIRSGHGLGSVVGVKLGLVLDAEKRAHAIADHGALDRIRQPVGAEVRGGHDLRRHLLDGLRHDARDPHLWRVLLEEVRLQHLINGAMVEFG